MFLLGFFFFNFLKLNTARNTFKTVGSLIILVTKCLWPIKLTLYLNTDKIVLKYY